MSQTTEKYWGRRLLRGTERWLCRYWSWSSSEQLAVEGWKGKDSALVAGLDDFFDKGAGKKRKDKNMELLAIRLYEFSVESVHYFMSATNATGYYLIHVHWRQAEASISQASASPSSPMLYSRGNFTSYRWLWLPSENLFQKEGQSGEIGCKRGRLTGIQCFQAWQKSSIQGRCASRIHWLWDHLNGYNYHIQKGGESCDLTTEPWTIQILLKLIRFGLQNTVPAICWHNLN